MIIPPDNPNQLKVRDGYGDVVFFDHCSPADGPSLIVTVRNTEGEYSAVQLDLRELVALRAFLARRYQEPVTMYYLAEVDAFGVLCVERLADEYQSEAGAATLAEQFPDSIYFGVSA